MTTCYNCGSTVGGEAVVYLPPGLDVARVLCVHCQSSARADRSYVPSRLPDQSETRLDGGEADG